MHLSKNMPWSHGDAVRTMLVIERLPTTRLAQSTTRDVLPHLDIEYDVSSVANAIEQAVACKYDIILLKLSGSDYSGLPILKDIRRAFPVLPLLFLSMQVEGRNVVKVLRSGADGYMQMEAMATELGNAISYLLRGLKYVS